MTIAVGEIEALDRDLTRSMAYHAELQHTIAEMTLALDTIAPHLDRVAADWSTGVNHGARVAEGDLQREVSRGRKLVEGRRPGARGRGRLRHLPPQRARADVPRRAARPHPPGQLDADARDRREDGARHQPGRNAAVGVIGSTLSSSRPSPQPVFYTNMVGLISSAISEIRSTGKPRAAGVLADGFGARGVVLAVDLAVDIGDIAAYPADVRHPGKRRVRSPSGFVQLPRGSVLVPSVQ